MGVTVSNVKIVQRAIFRTFSLKSINSKLN